MKLQMFFYQNLVKNQNFRHKFTFPGFSQNFVFGEVVPLCVRGHVCINMEKKKKRISASLGLFDLQKLLNLVIKLLFILHGFSTMTSSVKILLFDLRGFKPWFQNSFETFETTSGGF